MTRLINYFGLNLMQPTSPINSTQTRPVTPATSISQSENAAVSQVVTESIAAVKFAVGQQIQATIQQQVSPGLYKVQIAGQSMQIQLPGPIKTGSTITLQVMSTSPKLTFSVSSSSAPISTAEEISSTSRLLSNLTQQPLSRTPVESASGRAVWPSENTVPESGKLAVALKDALANSGLFYESHQAQWVAGTRSTAQLLVEPQNLLAPMTKNAPPGTTSAQVTAQPGRENQSQPAGTAPALVQPEPASKAITRPDAHAAAFSQSAPGIADTQTKGATTDATSNAPLPIAKELIPLVQQQLHTLETHQLTWSGQVWPNQQMQWEIQGEPEHRTALPDERQWKTEMELALPRLGDVRARLVFHQGAVSLALHAANSDASALFDRRLPELATAMKNAGIPLSGAVVEKS